MRSSVSIALFLLLSGFFLSLLLGAIEHSRKLWPSPVAVSWRWYCIIVLLTPVQLPNLGLVGRRDEGSEAIAGSTTTSGCGRRDHLDGRACAHDLGRHPDLRTEIHRHYS